MLQEALDEASRKMIAGDYASAEQILEREYHQLPTLQEDCPVFALYYLQIARCHQELGMMKKV